MAANDVCTLETLKEWLRIAPGSTKDDAILKRIISSVSGAIEKRLGRQVLARSISETYDGPSGVSLWLRHFPISALTTLKQWDTSHTVQETIGSGSYALNARTGELRLIDGAWTPGFQNVEVVYTAGLGATVDDLPVDLVTAALEVMKIVYDRLITGTVNATTIAVGPMNYMIAQTVPKDIRDAIDAYRRAKV